MTASGRTYRPPGPQGVGLGLMKVREVIPATKVPLGVVRYSGPPESPKQVSTPLPPAASSPPGLTEALQPDENPRIVLSEQS